MPAFLPAIAAIAGLAGTGVSTGLALANQPSSQPQPATAPVPAPPTADQNSATEIAARMGQRQQAGALLPNLEDQTSGSLTPPEYNIGSSELAGTFGANPSTTNSGGNMLDLASTAPTGSPDLQAIIEQLQGLAA